MISRLNRDPDGGLPDRNTVGSNSVDESSQVSQRPRSVRRAPKQTDPPEIPNHLDLAGRATSICAADAGVAARVWPGPSLETLPNWSPWAWCALLAQSRDRVCGRQPAHATTVHYPGLPAPS